MGAAEDDAVGAASTSGATARCTSCRTAGVFSSPLSTASTNPSPTAGSIRTPAAYLPLSSPNQSLPSEARVASTPMMPLRVVAAAGLMARLHPDEGNGIGCPQPFDGYHRGRIAGQYDKFGSCAEQRAHGIVDIAGHLFGGLFRRRGSVPRRRSRRPTPPAGLCAAPAKRRGRPCLNRKHLSGNCPYGTKVGILCVRGTGKTAVVVCRRERTAVVPFACVTVAGRGIRSFCRVSAYAADALRRRGVVRAGGLTIDGMILKGRQRGLSSSGYLNYDSVAYCAGVGCVAGEVFVI